MLRDWLCEENGIGLKRIRIEEEQKVHIQRMDIVQNCQVNVLKLAVWHPTNQSESRIYSTTSTCSPVTYNKKFPLLKLYTRSFEPRRYQWYLIWSNTHDLRPNWITQYRWSEKKLEKTISKVKQPPSENLACQVLVHENLVPYNQLFHLDLECSWQ